MTTKLSRKREAFVAAFLKSFNAKQAAKEAGYASPGAEGHRLLKVAEIRDAINTHLEDIRKEGLGNRATRLAQLSDLNDDLLAIQRARAEEADTRRASGEVLPAGAETGLLVERRKQFGTGARAVIETVWEIDTTLVRERQSILEQAAREVGDRDKRLVEVTGKDGGPVQIESAKAKLLELIEGNDDGDGAS